MKAGPGLWHGDWIGMAPEHLRTAPWASRAEKALKWGEGVCIPEVLWTWLLS